MTQKVKAMVQATAQKRKELPDGTPVTPPAVLQLAWMVRRWGVGILGNPPDFKLLGQIDRALAIEYVFDKKVKDRTEEDWELIKATLAEVEKWQNAG